MTQAPSNVRDLAQPIVKAVQSCALENAAQLCNDICTHFGISSMEAHYAQICFYYYAGEYEIAHEICVALSKLYPMCIDHCFYFAECAGHLGQFEALYAAIEPMTAPCLYWNKLQLMAEIYEIIGDDEAILKLGESDDHHHYPDYPFGRKIFYHKYATALIRHYGLLVGMKHLQTHFISSEAIGILFHKGQKPADYWCGETKPPKILRMSRLGGVGDMLHLERYVAPLLANGMQSFVHQYEAPLSLSQSRLQDYQRPAYSNLFASLPDAPLEEMFCSAFSLLGAHWDKLGYLPPQKPVFHAESNARLPDILSHIKRAAKGKPLMLIFWSANESGGSFGHRSLRLKDVQPLLARDDVHWVVGQRGLERQRFEATAEAHNATILPSDFNFADLCALIEAIDGVVSIDSSVAHLAASQLKPTWLLLSYAAEWRWEQHPTATPWYHSMTLVRQEKAGDWAGLVKKAEYAIFGGHA
jgi:Glycosyltransferase family 9 (heptosyltransferase)